VLDAASCAALGVPAMPDNNAPDEAHRAFTAEVCAKVWDFCPEAVVTSEDYGDGFAAYMAQYFGRDIAHICVDRAREAVPVSASRIRGDIHAERRWLSPAIYQDFVQTVCFIGAESTGKSILTDSLAQDYGTEAVREYGRELWEAQAGTLAYGDYLKIARTHIAREQDARQKAHRFLFVDTSPLVTLFYCLDQFGRAEEELYRLAARTYDHVFLCAPDFPLVQDGTRRDEAFRQRQDRWYRGRLVKNGTAFTELRGSLGEKVVRVGEVMGDEHPKGTSSLRSGRG